MLSSGNPSITCSKKEGRSKRLIFGESQRVAEWVRRQTGGNLWDGQFVAIGLEQGGEIIAGLGFNSYIPGGSVSGHIAAIPGRRWITRPFLRALFMYPFMQLKVQRFNAFLPAKNAAVIRFAEHLGFTFEHRMPRMLVNDDVLIYRMFREDCQWLNI